MGDLSTSRPPDDRTEYGLDPAPARATGRPPAICNGLCCPCRHWLAIPAARQASRRPRVPLRPPLAGSVMTKSGPARVSTGVCQSDWPEDGRAARPGGSSCKMWRNAMLRLADSDGGWGKSSRDDSSSCVTAFCASCHSVARRRGRGERERPFRERRTGHELE